MIREHYSMPSLYYGSHVGENISELNIIVKVTVARYDTLPPYELSQCQYGLTRRILVCSTKYDVH
jgi:hypothetical protein